MTKNDKNIRNWFNKANIMRWVKSVLAKIYTAQEK